MVEHGLNGCAITIRLLNPTRYSFGFLSENDAAVNTYKFGPEKISKCDGEIIATILEEKICR